MVKKGLLPAALMAFGSALLGTVFTPSPALAGKSCNYLNTSLFMAQGYQNQNDIWVSEGWWVIKPGECVVYADNAFTYFKIHNGVAPSRPFTAQDQAESVKLCQVNDRFTVFQADQGRACANAGGNVATFINPGSTLELIKLPQK